MRKLFIDTANLDHIKKINSLGVIRGVTTNPSLISKEPKQNFDALIEQLASFCQDSRLSLSVEVFASKPEDMLIQARELHRALSQAIDPDLLHIKIPVGFEELTVIKQLSSEGINVNCTCCFTEQQLQLAALSGSKYVSLFYSRLRDFSGNPPEVLRRTRGFIDTNGLDCEIIAGSIRSQGDVSGAWENGCDIVTCSYSIIEQMTKHPKTDVSVAGFLRDFNNWIGN
ncbi:fructose-6-phosphate aldolase [Candidatus Pacearchaeota archaeon]|nr:fructose-6-phosphate aldolase [Candidatus Pacearchaeota archaeon]